MQNVFRNSSSGLATQVWLFRLSRCQAIGKHSLYQYIYEEERDIFGKICNTCICEKIVDKGHEVFAAGDEGRGRVRHDKDTSQYALTNMKQ